MAFNFDQEDDKYSVRDHNLERALADRYFEKNGLNMTPQEDHTTGRKYQGVFYGIRNEADAKFILSVPVLNDANLNDVLWRTSKDSAYKSLSFREKHRLYIQLKGLAQKVLKKE